MCFAATYQSNDCFRALLYSDLRHVYQTIALDPVNTMTMFVCAMNNRSISIACLGSENVQDCGAIRHCDPIEFN